MQKILKYKNTLIFILSIITVIAISINVARNEFVYGGNNFKWVIWLIILCVLFSKAKEKYNKRLFICSGIFSLVIGLFTILGFMASNEEVQMTKNYIIMLLFKYEAIVSILTSIMMIIMSNIPKAMEKIKGKKELKLFTANKKSIFFVAGIIFLAYVPYLLNYYPGNVLIDSVIQILQGVGATPLTNHHPVLHTGIIAICINLGNFLFNSYEIGAFIYTLLQTIATSLIFSFSIYYMARKNVPVLIRVLTLLFYMFCPTICFYTVTMYKDIPFALSVLLVTIALTELTTNTKNFFSSKSRMIFLALMILLAMFFRNNGVYAIILTFPFVLVVFRKYYKQVLLIFLLPIIIYEVITGPIYNAVGIEQGSTREALSIPIQQFARLMVNEEENLTDEEKEKIRQYLPIDNFEELYDPVFADPVKTYFSDEGFEQDKLGLVKLYIELAIKFPVETFESFINGSYGYYYPNTVGWGIYTGVSEELFKGYEEYAFSEKPIVKIEVLDKLNEFVNTRDFPLTSMIISIGFLFWVVLACITYVIYTRQYKKILIFLPVLFIWLTALASPVFCEPRYVYSIFTCLPLFIAISVKNDGENLLEENKKQVNNIKIENK